jgi:hypothetical protein
MHMYPLHSLFLMPVQLQITPTVHNKAHHPVIGGLALEKRRSRNLYDVKKKREKLRGLLLCRKMKNIFFIVKKKEKNYAVFYFAGR